MLSINSHGPQRIGELLLERGVISQAQLEEGLAHHRQSRQRLGVALIQKGFLQESELARVLSEALGIPEVDLKGLTPEWAAIHTLRTPFCEANDLFPYALENARGRKQLLVAMADPLNAPAIEEIEFTTGLKVQARIAPLSAVRASIMRYYHRRNPDEKPTDGMTVIQAKGVTFTVGDNPPDDEVIVGEELGPEEPTERSALAIRMKEREEQVRAKRSAKSVESLSKDLDYLFGVRDEADAAEKLERKFWALMRIMARKGLITNEEFTKELDEEDPK